jgi:Fe-S-cluster formation regulator IscX/YfhJ
MKILPVGTKLFHANSRTDRHTDRQIDITKLIVALGNFANAPKKKNVKIQIVLIEIRT